MVKNKIISLLRDMLAVIYRFPVPTCSISILTIITALHVLNKGENILDNQTFAASAVGFIAFIFLSSGIKLYAEYTNFMKLKQTYILYAISFLYSLFSGIFCFYQYDNTFIDYYITILPLVSFLIILVLPFIGKNIPDSLWNYIVKLLTSIIISIIYSIPIFGGLALISAAIDSLFGVYIFNPELLAVIVFIFIAPLMVLAQVPKSFDEYDMEPDYPIIGKILIKYIFFSLIVIYGCVLYVYAIKILVTWSLPKGVVAYMITFFAFFATILCYLLYPYAKKEKGGLHSMFRKYFHYFLLPLLVLLFVALFKRTGEYGLTTNRYIILLVGIWFVVTSLYFTFKKGNNIVPLVYVSALLVLFFSFGPWSIFELPKRLQFSDFEKYATEQGVMKDGKLIKPAYHLSKEQNIILSGYIDFFIPDYKKEFIEKFCNNEEGMFDEGNTFMSDRQMTMLGINGKYYLPYKRLEVKNGLASIDNNSERLYIYSADNVIRDIQQYTHFFHYLEEENDTLLLPFDSGELKIVKDSLTNVSFIYPGIDTLSINFSKLAADIYNNYTPNSYNIELQSGDCDTTLVGKKINLSIKIRNISVPVNMDDRGIASPISPSTCTRDRYNPDSYNLECFLWM